jgi:hypothetical protein
MVVSVTETNWRVVNKAMVSRAIDLPARCTPCDLDAVVLCEEQLWRYDWARTRLHFRCMLVSASPLCTIGVFATLGTRPVPVVSRS